MDASGFLVPRIEGLLLTAASWGSSKWAHWNDGRHVVLRVSAGRTGDDRQIAMDDDELLAALRDDLAHDHGHQRCPGGHPCRQVAARIRAVHRRPPRPRRPHRGSAGATTAPTLARGRCAPTGVWGSRRASARAANARQLLQRCSPSVGSAERRRDRLSRCRSGRRGCGPRPARSVVGLLELEGDLETHGCRAAPRAARRARCAGLPSARLTVVVGGSSMRSSPTSSARSARSSSTLHPGEHVGLGAALEGRVHGRPGRRRRCRSRAWPTPRRPSGARRAGWWSSVLPESRIRRRTRRSRCRRTVRRSAPARRRLRWRANGSGER